MIYLILIIYVILGFISYFAFKKMLSNSNFEYVWFAIFWPATWGVMGIGALKDYFFKGKE